jgi:hypothetical protein
MALPVVPRPNVIFAAHRLALKDRQMPRDPADRQWHEAA